MVSTRSFFSLSKTFVTSFALYLSRFLLESHFVCRSIITYCDGSFRNYSFSMDLTHEFSWLLQMGCNQHLFDFLYFIYIGLLLLIFAKWQWTNEIPLYFIHFSWELAIGVVYNISWHKNLVALESSKWTCIPTSLQVLGLYIPCSSRFCHLL